VIVWDASALVKVYFGREAGHARAASMLQGPVPHAGSILLRPEAASAFTRRLSTDRRARDAVLSRLQDALAYFLWIPMDDGQVDLAVKLILAHRLKAGDGIHLAAATTLARQMGRTRVRFATADRHQTAAARAEGIRVIQFDE
jgi:predicted nucleic acid-binding protein